MNRFIQMQYDNGQPSHYNEYMDYPLIPLRIALEPLLSSIDQLDYHIKSSKNDCHYPSSDKLSLDESAAVYFYAEEWGKQTLNSTLNQALRSGKYLCMKPWFPFLKLFNTALEKLPTVSGTFWRGMRIDIATNLRHNEQIIWGSVSSCSSLDVIKCYLGNNYVLCSIEVINGKSIRGYTRYTKENEVLLLPGTRLRVKKNDYNFFTGERVVYLIEICNDSHNVLPSANNSVSSSSKPSQDHSTKNEPKTEKVFSATTFTNGDRYEVAYENGEKAGHGVFFYDKDKMEEGLLADIKATGNGTRTWSNWDKYKGAFHHGRMSGYGIYSRADGYTYVGNWIADEAYGKGTSTWPNGNSYEGYHEKGKITGYGTFRSSAEDEYKGDLVDGKAHGTGVRCWAAGDRYQGDFRDDKKHGFGTYTYSGGGKYSGNWINDEMDGHGTLNWPSGTQYKGVFKNGKRHGRGRLTFANGKTQYGDWENDKFIG